MAKIKLGLQEELRLGNLEARRDWGFAPEFVAGMWAMIQQSASDDYVIATGETHSVGEFAQHAFEAVGLNWKDYVVSDQRLHRPLDVHQLCGSYRKAEHTFGWKPRVTFKQLVKIMVDADLKRWERYLNGEVFPWDAPNYSQEMDIISRNVVRDSQKEASRKRQKRVKFLRLVHGHS